MPKAMKLAMKDTNFMIILPFSVVGKRNQSENLCVFVPKSSNNPRER